MVQAIRQVDAPAASQHGIRVVTGASLISLVCIFCTFWSWMPYWEYFGRFPGLVCILPFLLPYGFVPLRLYQGRILSGLVLAVVMSCALLVPGVFLLRFVFEWQRSWWLGTNLTVALLMQPVMLVEAVRALGFMQIVQRDWRKISGSLVYGIMLFGIFWLVFSPVPRKIIDSESEAESRLRDISLYNSWQSYISDLVCDTDHLLYLLHPHPENGYNFVYRVVASKTSVKGCRVDTSFIITARPIAYRRTGIRSFLFDQSEQDKRSEAHSLRIHFTSEDRPATLSDPTDQVSLLFRTPY